MPPHLSDTLTMLCVCTGLYLNSWNAVFLSCSHLRFQSGPARRAGHRVTTAPSSSSLFDVKACKKISFQYLHAHCTCTVSCCLCNPSCHSDSIPPISPLCVCDRCEMFPHRISLSLKGCDEEAMPAHRRGDTDVRTGCTPRRKDKHAAINNHILNFQLLQKLEDKIDVCEAVICRQMCGAWNRK